MGKKAKSKGKETVEKAGPDPLEQLRDDMRKQTRTCDDEEHAYHHYLSERERIHYFFVVEKKTLQELQSELRNKERELQDLEERQQIELKVYQQRIKHLRFHHLTETSDQRVENEEELRVLAEHNEDTEAALVADRQALKQWKREVEAAQDDFSYSLKLNHDSDMLALRQEYDRKARDLQKRYALRLRDLRENLENKRKRDLQAEEESKNAAIQQVMNRNLKEFADIKVYFGDITSSNLDLIKRLKEEHEDIRKREVSDTKQMNELTQRNRQLTEPLKKATERVSQLELQKVSFVEDKRKLEEMKSQVREVEGQLAQVELQSEVLLQQHERAQLELKTLDEQLHQAVYDVHQKAGLKNLLLEKKLTALGDLADSVDAQVSEVLGASETGGATAKASQKLEGMLTAKDEMIATLTDEVSRIKDAYRTMIGTYRNVLGVHGVAVDDLGFTPADL